ncbi:hypothetical protein HK103_005471 [Boothiomyces macroporosus]|uniref:Uncharacterized protein n=1 Tax=Boothiomyces macroporosus TaxID=261099 RepID=A0AAD5Y2R1_9FUNG|nr:hypothetical protein HK103_005471 [Boothiomyces macroporosus]
MIFQSLWTTYQCQGVPSSFLIFNDSLNTVPQFYYWINYIPYCGYNNFPTATGEGCCVNSIDLGEVDGSQGRTSWLNTELGQDWSVYNAAHSQANGHTYCQITNTTLGIYNDTVTAYFLTNNECIYGGKCDGNILSIYQDISCQNLIETFNVQPGVAEYHSSIGNVSVSLFTFTEAKNYVNWITSAPGGEIVNQTKSVFDILSVLFYAVAIAIATGVLLYYLQRRKVYFLIMATVCAGRTVLYTVYSFTIYTDSLKLAWTNTFLDASKIYYLFGNYLSCSIVNRILNIHSDYKRFISYTLVTLIYVGLEAPMIYQDYLLILANFETIDLNLYYSVSLTAYSADNAYTVIMFIVDFTPVLLLFMKIVHQRRLVQKKKGEITNWKALVLKYWKILVIFGFQLFIVGVYVLSNYITHYTIWLGSDQAVIDMTSIFVCIANNHYLLIVILYEYLTMYVAEFVKPAKKPQLVVAADSNSKAVEKTAMISGTVKMN